MELPASRNVIDITVSISPSTEVFPGDPEPLIERVCTLDADGCAVSRLTLGSHTGTHVDSPSHVLKGGITVDSLELEGLIGRAVLLDFSLINGALSGDALESTFISAGSPGGVKVLLLKMKNSECQTGSGTDLKEDIPEPLCFNIENNGGSNKNGENGWLENSVYLEESAAAWIVRNGFATVGIDGFSVDSPVSRKLPAHHILLSNRINIVECLDLSSVETGTYFFVCLPLKITGCDGAPARAVLLRDLDS